MTAIEPHFRPRTKAQWRRAKWAKSSPKRRASTTFCSRLPGGRETCRGNVLRSGLQRPTDTKRGGAIRLSRPQRTNLCL